MALKKKKSAAIGLDQNIDTSNSLINNTPK